MRQYVCLKKIIIILFLAVLFSCKTLEKNEFKNINKYLIYYNYNTNKICLFNLQTGNIDKNYRIEMDILKGGALNKQGFAYEWFYKENDNNIYLMEGSRSKSIIGIYKINIDNFEISQTFKTDLWYSGFFIEDNNLYLLRFIEPSNGKLNYEQNYIVLYNLLNKEKTIINFNELLPEDEKVRASYFSIYENKILFAGYRKIYFRKLFLYDITEKTTAKIDEYVDYDFSINKDIILYKKWDVEEITDGVRILDTNFYVYNLRDNSCKILPYKGAFFNYLIIDEKTIIYTDRYFKKSSFPINTVRFPMIKCIQNFILPVLIQIKANYYFLLLMI